MLKVLGLGDNVCDVYLHTGTMYPGGQAMNFSVYAKMLGAQSAYLGVFEMTEWQNTLFLFLMRSGSIIPDAGNMPARMGYAKSPA